MQAWRRAMVTGARAALPARSRCAAVKRGWSPGGRYEAELALKVAARCVDHCAGALAQVGHVRVREARSGNGGEHTRLRASTAEGKAVLRHAVPGAGNGDGKDWGAGLD